MIRTPLHPAAVLSAGDARFSFLDTGDIFEFTSAGCLLNSLLGNPKDGSANNIWLRFYENGAVSKAMPLLGIRSESTVAFESGRVIYRGTADGVHYTVTFTCGEGETGEIGWLWHAALSGSGQVCDLVYGQDIGVGDKGGVLTNELYIAQYLGHSIFETENGYTVCSRQNQKCGCGNPFLQQGVLNARASHYSTDGMQFFTTDYRACGVPAALSGDLPDQNYQYELSYTALQTEKLTLTAPATCAFYALFRPNHAEAVTAPFVSALPRQLLAAAAAPCAAEGSRVRLSAEMGPAFASPAWTEEEIDARWPSRRLEEKDGTTTLSFFTPEHAYVALRQKELLCERSHGMIHMTMPAEKEVSRNLLATTSYMCGAFMSQVILGNTNFHKAVSAVRSPLNLMTNSGVRLYVKLDGQYRLLTLPSAYETGFNHASWYYDFGGDRLCVAVYTHCDTPAAALTCTSESGKTYDCLLTAQLLFGEQEFTAPVTLEKQGNTLLLTGEKPGFVQARCPDLHYRFHLPEGAEVTDDGIFFADGESRNSTLLVIKLSGSDFRIALEGCMHRDAPPLSASSLEAEQKKYADAVTRFSGGISVSLPKDHPQHALAEKLNETIRWYTHNAMIHFASPHGLEQPGGAAWGTRDVCQGPMEYFLMAGNFTLARSTLCEIFRNQQLHTGEWPQWFMFDGYPINAGECHGDVVFWPLKALSDYLLRTHDTSILSETLDYLGADNGPAGQPEALLEHVRRAVETVRATRFVGETKLVSYAGGDWDDTLQPADPRMKQHLISAWTVALSYQAFRRLSETLPADEPLTAELSAIADDISRDFHTLLIGDGIIAGFALEETDGLHYLLHPRDEMTGIHYRLLPQTRSIIAELVDKKQADSNMALIDDKLKCPDGVRLMDRPAAYNGGVSRLFLRAEQAANVGREISLQYVHAHIRYVEACAKLGQADTAWDALLRVNPICLQEILPQAARRQSNLYFSSSEGKFLDRMEYARDFDKLKSGEIDVKGGWRLYSSGPGIYLNQLVSHLLGITFTADGLVLDPVLPKSLDGLSVSLLYNGTPLTLCYRVSGTTGEVHASKDGSRVSSAGKENPYRAGACFVPAAALSGTLNVER